MRLDVLRPYFLLTLLLAALVLVTLVFWPFLIPLALAAVFAVVLRPIFGVIQPYVGGSRALAAAITLIIAVVGLLAPLAAIVTQIFFEASNLYSSLTGGEGLSFITAALAYIESLVVQYVPGFTLNLESIVAELDTYARQALEVVLSHAGGILSSTTGFLLNLFIFFIALYYILKDGRTLKRTVVELSPLYDTDDQFVFKRLETAINSVVRGSLLVALIQGVIATTGYFIFGVPNAVLWGTTTAVAALIPGVGTALVLGPIALYLFMSGAGTSAIGLLIWGVVAVGLVDNLIGPMLIGRGAKLHPLLILLSVLGGLVLFGPAGIFLGPLVVSLFLAILSIHAHTIKRE